MSEEIIIINNEPFYRIPNGTSYDYAPIPKEFKPYFEKIQQENNQLKDRINKLEKGIKHYMSYNTNEGLLEYCMRDLLSLLKGDKE